MPQTATQTGKQGSVSWTAAASSDTSYYRVFRNATLLGTTSTVSFTDNPTLGDTTAPGAPSSVTATQANGTVTVSWTAPANSTFVYNITTVDTSGNLASSNGTSGGASITPVAH